MEPWQPATPRLRPLPRDRRLGRRRRRVWFTAAILPGFGLASTGAAFLGAAVIALLNAVLPPILAALRLPFMLAIGFLLVLLANAAALMLAHEVLPDDIQVDSFGDALLASILIAAVRWSCRRIVGTNDDDEYTLRVTRRIARRGGGGDADRRRPASSTSRSTASPSRCSATRCATAARRTWPAGSPRTATGSSSGRPTCRRRPAPSQAGILLGSNEDIPAFRWVEKETGRIMTCSSPSDCAEIEQRRATGIGLLRDGGASRGNLLSGEADETILTVSRTDAEKRANPGYRAFLANGFNVTRTLVLFFWEVVLEIAASHPRRAARRAARADTAAACTRSCARRCACSCATSSSSACSAT